MGSLHHTPQQVWSERHLRVPENSNGIRVWTISITNQWVTIHYNNCIGAFEVPDRRKLPERDILLETGKGVTLSYAPAQIAI